jgi:hypothetical protein
MVWVHRGFLLLAGKQANITLLACDRAPWVNNVPPFNFFLNNVPTLIFFQLLTTLLVTYN